MDDSDKQGTEIVLDDQLKTLDLPTWDGDCGTVITFFNKIKQTAGLSKDIESKMT